MGKSRKPNAKSKSAKKNHPQNSSGSGTAPSDLRLDSISSSATTESISDSEQIDPETINKESDISSKSNSVDISHSAGNTYLPNTSPTKPEDINRTGESSEFDETEHKNQTKSAGKLSIENLDTYTGSFQHESNGSHDSSSSDIEQLSHTNTASILDQEDKRGRPLLEVSENKKILGHEESNTIVDSVELAGNVVQKTDSSKQPPQSGDISQNNMLDNSKELLQESGHLGDSSQSNLIPGEGIYAVPHDSNTSEEETIIAKEKKSSKLMEAVSSENLASFSQSRDSIHPTLSHLNLSTQAELESRQNVKNTPDNPTESKVGEFRENLTSSKGKTESHDTNSASKDLRQDTDPVDNSKLDKLNSSIAENSANMAKTSPEILLQRTTNETVGLDGVPVNTEESDLGNNHPSEKQEDKSLKSTETSSNKSGKNVLDSHEDSHNLCGVNDNEKGADAAKSRDSISEPHQKSEIFFPHTKTETGKKNYHLTQLPSGWSLEKLDIELPLNSGEVITCAASHDSNLYLGTSHGQIFHLYLFDDADQYILIMMMSVSENNQNAVSKILVVPDAEMLLALAAKTIFSFTLPELAPCRGGKIKDVEDVSLLSVGRLKSEKNRADKVVVYTSSKLRVVHVTKNGIKLLRDINYAGAKIGVSSASGTSAHYSNICIIANDQRYDVVDMQQARKIPLFDYNPAENPKVIPHIIPYQAQDSLSVDSGSDGESSASGKSAKSDTSNTSASRVLEEYLLSICTEESTSMAMFINSAGDATRGTVTWIGHGYPVHGISIEWPLIVGLFQIGDDTTSQKMVFSSLESLEVIAEIGCHDLFKGCSSENPVKITNAGSEVKVVDRQLSRYLTLVACGSRNEVSPQKQFGTSKTVISDGTRLYVLQKQSQTSEKINKILNILATTKTSEQIIELLKQEIPYYSRDPINKENGQFFTYMHVTLLLLCEQYAEIRSIFEKNKNSKVDPRLLILFCVSSSEVKGEFWETFRLRKVFLEIRDLVPENDYQKHREFYFWLLKHVYTSGDIYDDVIGVSVRKLIYTETCEGQESILTLIGTPPETESWSSQNSVNDELISFFEQESMKLVLLHLYNLKQNCGSTFESWPLKIIDTCLELLSENNKTLTGSEAKGKSDVIFVGTHKFDLPLLAFDQLRNHVEDEDLYTKKLLKLLQLCPERGLSILKSAKGSQHASTHKHILEELAKSYTFDSKFSLLKIEYTEQSFLETSKSKNEVNVEVACELFRDYLDYLNQDDLLVEYENLNILFHTYKLEDKLSDPQWPKITWIEYVHLHYKKGDYKEFLIVYLKLYEMVVLFSILRKPHPEKIPQINEAMSFLTLISNDEVDRESYLHELHDYTSAEWVAFYTHPNVPKTSFLLSVLEEFQLIKFSELSSEIQKKNFTRILEFYLSLEDAAARHSSVMHAVDTYAGHHLSVENVLSILPENFPLVFIQNYIMHEILSLEQRKSDSQLKKALHKANAKLHKSALKDYEDTRRNLDEMARNGTAAEKLN